MSGTGEGVEVEEICNRPGKLTSTLTPVDACEQQSSSPSQHMDCETAIVGSRNLSHTLLSHLVKDAPEDNNMSLHVVARLAVKPSD